MKKLLALILTAAMLALTLCACSGGDENEIDEASLIPIVVGVSKGKVPQEEILYGLEKNFPAKGYKLVYKEYATAKEANDALVNGEIDFSCISTKAEYEAYGNDAILNLGSVYFYPYSIYLTEGEIKSDIQPGSKVAIPDDADGMARALLLLAREEIITLKEGVGLSATLADIAENGKELEFIAVPKDKVASADAAVKVIHSVDAPAAGYERRFDALTSELGESEGAINSATVFLIRKADLTTDKIDLVQDYLFTRRMYNHIDDISDDLIEPMFEIQ